MNREFDLSSTAIRGLFASAAVLVTVLVIGAIAGLADHYSAEWQLANTHRAVVAHR